MTLITEAQESVLYAGSKVSEFIKKAIQDTPVYGRILAANPESLHTASNNRVKEPELTYITGERTKQLHREIGSAIKGLRDIYLRKHPSRIMPSNWLIDELSINSAKQYILQCKNWQERIIMALKQIILDTSYDECLYTDNRNNLPLFPNDELYNAWEVNLAMKELLKIAENQSIANKPY